MADVPKPATPPAAPTFPTPGVYASPASLLIPDTDKISGLLAGATIAAGDACYIKNDGKVWPATGAANTAPGIVRGFAATNTNTGEAVTLIIRSVWHYTPATAYTWTAGGNLYLSGTNAGGLADAASTGGITPIGFVIDAANNKIYLSGNKVN